MLFSVGGSLRDLEEHEGGVEGVCVHVSSDTSPDPPPSLPVHTSGRSDFLCGRQSGRFRRV